MVNLKIKKFSRSKVEEPIAEEENNIMIEDTEQEPIITKPKKGRPKKQKQEPIHQLKYNRKNRKKNIFQNQNLNQNKQRTHFWMTLIIKILLKKSNQRNKK